VAAAHPPAVHRGIWHPLARPWTSVDEAGLAEIAGIRQKSERRIGNREHDRPAIMGEKLAIGR
jgi:hypothetical protein